MPYEVNDNKHTLLVTRFGPDSKPDQQRFKLTGFMRVTRPDSFTFQHPLPTDMHAIVGITFDEIEFVPPIGNRVDEDAGEISLTHYNADMKTGQRAL